MERSSPGDNASTKGYYLMREQQQLFSVHKFLPSLLKNPLVEESRINNVN